MIIAHTGALVALIDADDRHHEALRALWEAEPGAWVVPWAVLPEVDHVVRRSLGREPAQLFLDDLAAGHFAVEQGEPADLSRAAVLVAQHAELGLSLVDGVVLAVAERLRAAAIAAVDLKRFGALELSCKLYPRDL